MIVRSCTIQNLTVQDRMVSYDQAVREEPGRPHGDDEDAKDEVRDIEVDTPAADRELCGLISQLAWRIESHVRDSVNSVEVNGARLSASQAIALRELTEPMSLRDLAGRMCCEASNTTSVVDKLEDAGLVHRKPHPHDRRTKLVVLTPSGEQARQSLLRHLETASPLAHLADEERGALRAALLQALTPAPSNVR